MRDTILKIFFGSMLPVMLFSGCSGIANRADRDEGLDYAVEHGRMMLKIEEAGVKDPLVLEAMRAVPRHKFFSGRHRKMAYVPRAVPPDPVLFARMVELLKLKGGEKILHLGTGRGYEAAVLSRIAGQVYSVDIVPRHVAKASKWLENLGYSNIEVTCSDPAAGWEKHAPFDAIIAIETFSEIPRALVSQLKEDGGMVISEGAVFSEDNIMFVTKKEGEVICEHAFPPQPAPPKQVEDAPKREAEK